MSILFIPIYIRYIGIEAYGLVGILGTLQAMASLLDLGFSMTAMREISRYRQSTISANQICTMVRSIEYIYWGIGLGISSIIVLSSQTICSNWITPVNLSQEAVHQAIYLIAIIVGVQWPFSFYSGGLIGLQKQGVLATINATIATTRAAGAVVILHFVSPTVSAFFAWQAAIGAISSAAVMLFMWSNLPKLAQRPQFSALALQRIWRFSLGVGLVGILGVVLGQIDKIVLSRVLSLEQFGYYSLAGPICASLYMLVNALYNGILPRLVQLVAKKNLPELAEFYHKSSEMMAAAVIPVVAVLVLHSNVIIFVWTGSLTAASETGLVVSLLAFGNGLHALAHVPWAVQLAHGWTGLGIRLYLIAVLLFIPASIILANSYGAVGGAAVWPLVNAFYLPISQIVMHKRFLKGELARWFWIDTGRPVIAAFAIAAIPRLYTIDTTSRVIAGIHLLAIGIITLFATLLVAKQFRAWILGQICNTCPLISR